MRTSVRITGARKLRRQLGRLGTLVLPDLADSLKPTAVTISTIAQASTPGKTGSLKASHFVDGPEIDKRHMSAGMTVGYAAEHAPFVHEGFHFGRKKSHPPRWLSNAAAGRVHDLADDVGKALMDSIAKHRSK